MVLEFRISRPPDNPIRQDEFDLVVEKSKAKPFRDSTAFYTMFSEQIAWLLLNFEQDSSIRLSLSLCNPKLDQLLEGTVRTAFRVATDLHASLSEYASSQQITAGNVDELADSSSEFFLNILARWDKSLAEMNLANGAPLEFPVDDKDYTNEYYSFSLEPLLPTRLADLERQLGFAIKKKNDSQGVVYEQNTLRPICKLRLKETGTVGIQPFYWKSNFSVAAGETLQIAELVAASCSAHLHFFQTPVTEELRAQLTSLSQNLGMNFQSKYLSEDPN